MGLLDKLNPSQREAVLACAKGRAVVIAGAGTGKTTVITHALANLIKSHNVSPLNTLLLTFTNRAAREMIERAAKLSGVPQMAFRGGTFHSFALKVIRKYHDRLDLPEKFTILDRDDTRAIFSDARSSVKSKGVELPNPGQLAEICSLIVNKQQNALDYLLKSGYDIPTATAMVKVFDQAEKLKALSGGLTFDDLLLKFNLLLAKKPRIKDKLQQRYHYICVDEYQDTNLIQEQMFLHLVGPTTRFMVVGDDAQTVYSWRGANHDNLLNMSTKFPKAKVVTLEDNYRSCQPILDVANQVQDQMEKSFRKTLRSGNKSGVVPKVVGRTSNQEEALFILQRIKDHIRAGGKKKEFAVLYRYNRCPTELELLLASNRIRYVKYGGIEILNTANAKDVLAFAKTVVNPTDSTSAKRVLQLHEGIGDKTTQQIWECSSESLSDKIRDYVGSKGGKTSAVLTRLANILKAMATVNTVSALKAAVGHYIDLPKLQNKLNPERKQELEYLAELASRFKTLEAFLDAITLEQPDDRDDKTKDRDAVVLSTIHSAKGLEWDNVVLMRAQDGVLPAIHYEEREESWEDADGNVLAKSSFVESTSPEELQEELRLVYVACTRPRKSLTVTWIKYNRNGVNRLCRFLKAIDRKTLKRLKSIKPKSTHYWDIM